MLEGPKASMDKVRIFRVVPAVCFAGGPAISEAYVPLLTGCTLFNPPTVKLHL